MAGGADDGLALGTFYGYVCKVKRALIYNAPLHIAERATNQELQKARQYVNDVLKDTEDADEDKMVAAYRWVKDQQIQEKQRLKDEAEKNSGGGTSTLDTPFTLPDPADYEDGDSDTLCQSIIQDVLALLTTRDMQPHLAKDIKSAKVLRGVLGDLTAFENQQAKSNAKKTAVA